MRLNIPNYKEIYPGISDEVLDVLVKSDRKMRYLEKDIKCNRYVMEGEKEIVLPARECSLDEAVKAGKDFACEKTDVAYTALKNVTHEKLRHCLSLLDEQEREIIDAIFFKGLSERKLAQQWEIPQKTLNNRKRVLLAKLKKILEI